jgi:pilus assembly protein CpaC
MVRTVPTRRWWMRHLSLRSWGGVTAGLLVLGAGVTLAQSPIIIRRAPPPAPAAGDPSQVSTTPPAAPYPPAFAPSYPLPTLSTPAPVAQNPAPVPPVVQTTSPPAPPAPILQLAPPPLPDPAPAPPPVKLPDVPDQYTPPAPPKPNPPPAARSTLVLPTLGPSVPPPVKPAPAASAVENAGWTTMPAQNPRPAPVPPPPPAGMPAAPVKAETFIAPAPAVPATPVNTAEVKPAPQPPALPPAPAPVGAAPRVAGEPVPGAAPVASAEVQKEYGRFVTSMVDPETTLDVVVGRPRVMVLADEPWRVQIGDDSVVGHEMLAPNELSLNPKAVGTTVLNLWLPDQADGGKPKILSYLVRVSPDPQAKERQQGTYRALADEINRAFPEGRVTLSAVGDKLAVSGEAKDAAQAAEILRVVRANAPGGAVGAGVVNLLRVTGEQQVQMRVSVAEVNRAAARSIGLSCGAERQAGVAVFAGRPSVLFGGSVPVFVDGGQTGAAIHALRGLNLARSLAEPNLVAVNGQCAEFRSGGEFPVPVLSGDAYDGRQGVEFRPYGVHLCCTPQVVDRDRIRLTVHAEVTARDPTAATSFGGAAVPGLNTRTFQTTVELREGQTLAVAGLVQHGGGAGPEWTAGLSGLLGVGRLFEAGGPSEAGEELILLITPELVRPPDGKVAAAPEGGDPIQPRDVEFYLTGHTQGRPAETAARLDPAQRQRFRHCEDAFLAGPQGYSDGR